MAYHCWAAEIAEDPTNRGLKQSSRWEPDESQNIQKQAKRPDNRPETQEIM